MGSSIRAQFGCGSATIQLHQVGLRALDEGRCTTQVPFDQDIGSLRPDPGS